MLLTIRIDAAEQVLAEVECFDWWRSSAAVNITRCNNLQVGACIRKEQKRHVNETLLLPPTRCPSPPGSLDESCTYDSDLLGRLEYELVVSTKRLEQKPGLRLRVELQWSAMDLSPLRFTYSHFVVVVDADGVDASCGSPLAKNNNELCDAGWRLSVEFISPYFRIVAL